MMSEICFQELQWKQLKQIIVFVPGCAGSLLLRDGFL